MMMMMTFLSLFYFFIILFVHKYLSISTFTHCWMMWCLIIKVIILLNFFYVNYSSATWKSFVFNCEMMKRWIELLIFQSSTSSDNNNKNTSFMKWNFSDCNGKPKMNFMCHLLTFFTSFSFYFFSFSFIPHRV
jgi:hypothetical protein